MIEETIRKLEERLKSSPTITEQNRSDLLELIQELKGEVSKLSRTDTEHVQKILDHTTDAIQESTPQETSAQGLNDQLRESVVGFENSHPQLVQVVNRMAEILADLGI